MSKRTTDGEKQARAQVATLQGDLLAARIRLEQVATTLARLTEDVKGVLSQPPFTKPASVEKTDG